MAVDYSHFDTYRTTKSSYKSSLDDAKYEDSQKNLDRMLNYAGIGAGFGKTGIGKFFGALGGFILGAFATAIMPYNSNERELYADVRKLNSDYYNSASTEQQKRNDYIKDAQYYINQSKSNFAQTYGKESFNMLESTINTLLDMDSTTAGQQRMSDLLGNLDQDSIVGEIESRIFNIAQPVTDDKGNYVYETDADGKIKIDENGEPVVKMQNMYGQMDKPTLDAMETKYLDISTLGSQYISSLYEYIVNSDSAYGDSANQLSKQEKLAAEEVEQNFEQTMGNTASKFAELFLNQRSSNISNAEQMGKTEAASGASGIKASKSSRTNNQITKLNQDIASASYAILYDSYRKQLSAAVENGQLTQEQVGFQYAAQRKNLERQITQAYTNEINTYYRQTTQYASTIGGEEQVVDEYIAGAKAGESFLKDNDQSYDQGRQYIYTTSSATV